MRDRRFNPDIPPRYRDRRNYHVDRRSDATHRHKPAPRIVRMNGSPPLRSPPHRSPPRRDLIPRQSDHLKPVHLEARDHLSPHHPRRHHSPTIREYHHNLHVPSNMHPDYSTDLSHGIKRQSHGHGLDPHPTSHKPVYLDDRPSRSYPTTVKHDSILDDMPASGIHDSDLHRRHSHTQDLYGGDRDRDRDRDIDRDIDRNRHMDRDKDRGRDRETGKGLYQREAPHPITMTTTHLGPLIEGGQSSYGHGKLCEHRHAAPEDISKVALGRLPDALIMSRDLASDRYNNLVLDDMYGKMPYSTLDYSRVDVAVYSPKAVREGRVYGDLPHHSTHKDAGPIYHEFEQGRLARPLHRHGAPLHFEDRLEFHREVAGVEREIPPSPIVPDDNKGLHCTDYSPSHNGYDDEPSDERLMAWEHQLWYMHDHGHVHDRVTYDDRIFDDDDDDVDSDENGDEDGHVANARITVKDRLDLSSPLVTDVDLPAIRRGLPSRKPVVIHGKHYHSKMTVPAAVRTNSVKKRLRSGPLDLRRENFRAYKMQKRGMDDEPYIRKLKYEYKRGSDEDAVNVVSPIMTDPREGSEEFNKQLEMAFFKYSKTINESSREKKRFLQPEKGNIFCYVCGRQSKEFSETHNLVVHAFHTRKSGLRTAHLGLHKALCLLMGWNWLISPDESKQYQVSPPAEAKVLKQDLILWPPIVVIRNSSIVCNASKSKTISIDMIGSMLKELGIGEGKAKVSYGIPSNLSVILVKFPPMGSGFELAEELHNHFYQANHGKEHLDLLKSCASATSNKNTNEKEIEDMLYGYMAGIEDLENLDSDTKRMYLAGKDTIRSKKVIKARISEDTQN